MRKYLCALSSLGLIVAVAAPLRADFIPGRIYVSAVNREGCFGPPNDRIYEFDPLTGNAREFSVLPNEWCGALNGLSFTPDASALRAAVFLPNVILELDGNANTRVALDVRNGLAGPLGWNGIAYDQQDRFYVVNFGNDTILRFPAGGGPAIVFGDRSDGVRGPGPITPAPNGDLYYAAAGLDDILRFTGPGEAALFDTLPPQTFGVDSLATDSSGNLFVLTVDGLFRYDAGDPSSRRLLAELGGSPAFSAIALSPDEGTIYVADVNRIFSVDAQLGTVANLGFIDAPPGLLVGGGIAVYVPEPSTLILLLAGLLVSRTDRTIEFWR